MKFAQSGPVHVGKKQHNELEELLNELPVELEEDVDELSEFPNDEVDELSENPNEDKELSESELELSSQKSKAIDG